MASKTVSMASACPRAMSTWDCCSPSADRIALCLAPSAVRICDWRIPSAVRMAARLSRSARNCFSIASVIEPGGSIALSSTLLTRIPHFPVASSRTPRNWALISSREVSVFSRSIPPITLRSVVTVSCSMPWMKLAISYVAALGSMTWKYSTVSMCTTRLSSVMTGCGAKETTCSRRSTFARIRSTNGTTVLSPASSVRLYEPSRSTTYARACGTTRTARTSESRATAPTAARTINAITGAPSDTRGLSRRRG